MLYSYRLELPQAGGAAGGDAGGGGSLRASLEGEWGLLASRT